MGQVCLSSKNNKYLIITDGQETMDLEVTCPLCHKQYSDGNLPRLFTLCGHTYCEKCLEAISQPQGEGLKVVCPEDQCEVQLQRISLLPVNKALFNYLQAKKNNTSNRSIHSLKDQSFNVPKHNHSDHEDDDAEALITVINGKEPHEEACPAKEEQAEEVKVAKEKAVEVQAELCLLHNKQVELICLVDYQRLCSKCALFGQHRGHDFISLDQIQQGNRKIYETLLQIFDEKAEVLDQLTSKARREQLSEALNAKSNSLKKEIADKFKKIHDEIGKAERAVYHKLEEMVEDIEKKMRKLLVIDERTVNIYESWALQAQKRFNSYESGTNEGLLQFYLSGKKLIQSGKDTVSQLKLHQQNSTIQAKKYIQDIGVFFNEGPCLSALPKIAQLFENDKEYEKKMVTAFNEKENSKLFANCEFYEDIKKKVKTEAHEDDESLLELVDEFEQNHSSISTSSKILDESFLKVAAEKSTPTRMAKNTTSSHTPSAKVIPRKKNTLLITKEPPKEEKVREEKKEPPISKDLLKKRMRAIKIPEKYEKMLEGVLTDTLQAVDFTNAELGDAMVLQICEILKGSTRARTLKLIRNKITDQGFTKILPLLCGISTLNLSQNLLTQNCLNCLSDLRASLPALKTIILSQNKIAQRKCKVVVQRLRKMDLVISI